MSALFHPYLCGRKAAEWLIAMKTKMPFILLLLMSIVGLLYVVIWKDAALSGVLLSLSYSFFSIAMLCKYSLSEKVKNSIRVLVNAFSYASAAFVLISLWYNFGYVLTH